MRFDLIKNGHLAVKRRYWFLITTLLLLLIAWLVVGLGFFDAANTAPSIIVEFDPPLGFQQADGPWEWDFPQDFGPHPDFQTEWWYYTGNLETDTGERFGYQLTIFRRALLPEEDTPERDSAWAADQVYMAHFALSDISADKHYAFERFSRGADSLAGAQADPFKVWLENWRVVQTPDGLYHLSAKNKDIAVDLILKDLKGPILHGDQGYSQKGSERGNASYYYSLPRLETTGTLQTAEGIYQVEGLSWKDHEFSTDALSSGQVGWDWFSLQLTDGSELMIYQVRRDDGSIDPYSSGTWISPEGKTVQLGREQFEIQVTESWKSQQSGADYPAGWRISITTLDLDLEAKPMMNDQEMNVSYTYWEGAVELSGTKEGMHISGKGYIELTGYTESMEGQF